MDESESEAKDQHQGTSEFNVVGNNPTEDLVEATDETGSTASRESSVIPKKRGRKSAVPAAEIIASQRGLPQTEDVPPAGNNGRNAEEDLILEQVYNHKANRDLREKYAEKAYVLASGCVKFWCCAVAANGFYFLVVGKGLFSDQAFIAITAGITINVLACFLGVIRGLFPAETGKTSKKRRTRQDAG